MFSKAIFQYAILAAFRDRLLWAVSILMLFIIILSIFSGSMAVIEQRQFTLVFMASGLRLLGSVGLVTFIGFQLRRLYDHKEIDYFFSAPLSRTSFIISLAVAYMLIALIFTLFISLILLSFGSISSYGVLLWGISIASEWTIVVAMAIFFSSVVKSATVSVLSSFAFYILARMIGVFTGIASSAMAQSFQHTKLADDILSVISIFVPRFDLLGQSVWLIHGVNDGIGIGFILIQTIVFVWLFLAAAAFDTQRNEF